MAFLIASSIGSDCGLQVEFDDGVGARVQDRSGKLQGVAAERIQVDGEGVLLEDQVTGEMVEWIRKMAINRRDVATTDPGRPIVGRTRVGTGHVDREVHSSLWLEEVPEVTVLSRRSPAEAVVVELEIVELDVQIHGPLLVSFEDDHAHGAQGGVAVGSAGVLDRDDLVFDADDGREVIDREGEQRAIPYSLAQPGHHVAPQAAFRWRGGVVPESAHLQIEHPAVERHCLHAAPQAGRQLAAEAFRQDQARELTAGLDDAGFEIDRSGESEPLETISAGGALELELAVGPGAWIDVEPDIAQDRGAVLGDGAGPCRTTRSRQAPRVSCRRRAEADRLAPWACRKDRARGCRFESESAVSGSMVLARDPRGGPGGSSYRRFAL